MEAVALFLKANLPLNSLFEGNNSRKNNMQVNTAHDFLCIFGDQSSPRMQEILIQSPQIFKISLGGDAPVSPRSSQPLPLTGFVTSILSWLAMAL